MNLIFHIAQEATSSGFWYFIGWVIIIGLILTAFIIAPLNFMFRVINRILRSKNIKNQGWPPPYCDADGDLIPSEYENEDSDNSQ